MKYRFLYLLFLLVFQITFNSKYILYNNNLVYTSNFSNFNTKSVSKLLFDKSDIENLNFHVEPIFDKNKELQYYTYTLFQINLYKPILTVYIRLDHTILYYVIHNYNRKYKLISDIIYDHNYNKKFFIDYSSKDIVNSTNNKNYLDSILFSSYDDNKNIKFKYINNPTYPIFSTFNNNHYYNLYFIQSKYFVYPNSAYYFMNSKLFFYSILSETSKGVMKYFYSITKNLISSNIKYYYKYIYNNNIIKAIDIYNNYNSIFAKLIYEYDEAKSLYKVKYYKYYNRLDHEQSLYKDSYDLKFIININYKLITRFKYFLIRNLDLLKKQPTSSEINYLNHWFIKVNDIVQRCNLIKNETSIFFASHPNNLTSISISLSKVNWVRKTFIGYIEKMWYNKLNDRIYLYTSNGIIYCINSFNGDVIWKFAVYKGSKITSNFKIFRDGISFKKDNTIFLLDYTTGKMLWHRSFDREILFFPTGDEQYIYILHSEYINQLYSSNGDIKAKIYYTDNDITAPLFYKDNKLLLFNNNNIVQYMINYINTDSKYMRSTWNIIDLPKTLNYKYHNTFIYLYNNMRELIKFSINNGEVIWVGEANDYKLIDYYIINNNTLVINKDKKYLVYIDSKTGNILHSFNILELIKNKFPILSSNFYLDYFSNVLLDKYILYLVYNKHLIKLDLNSSIEENVIK